MGFQCYAARSMALTEIGFASYQEYLDSNLWKSIRRRVLARDSKRCQSCGEKAEAVHHKKYTVAVLRGDKGALPSLVSLCHTCHHLIEFGEHGEKLDLAGANARLGVFNGGVRKPAKRKKPKRRMGDFRCPQCGRVFWDVTAITQHVKAKHRACYRVKVKKGRARRDDRLFKCALCDRRHLSAARMREHLRAYHDVHELTDATARVLVDL